MPIVYIMTQFTDTLCKCTEQLLQLLLTIARKPWLGNRHTTHDCVSQKSHNISINNNIHVQYEVRYNLTSDILLFRLLCHMPVSVSMLYVV